MAGVSQHVCVCLGPVLASHTPSLPAAADAAFAAAYARLAAVSFAGMQVRRDIGHQVRRF